MLLGLSEPDGSLPQLYGCVGLNLGLWGGCNLVPFTFKSNKHVQRDNGSSAEPFQLYAMPTAKATGSYRMPPRTTNVHRMPLVG
jgi:hypothetical protein